MRILHVCAGWQETNGAAVIARFVAEEQRRQGHDVRFGTWAALKEIRAADEVWTHCGWLPVLWRAGLFARRLVRMPEACYDPVRLAYHGWKKRLAGPVERFFLRRAQKVMATCEAERDWILAYEPKARVEVMDIKRFFNLESASPFRPSKPVHVLYLGRRHPLKGVEYLERAVDGMQDVELRIVSEAVGAAKDAAWDWCDVLVLPTLSENFGLVVAEALERGKCVITTDGAPAWWEDDRNYGGRLVCLKGYRDGDDETRVRLLKDALTACQPAS